MPVSPRRVSCDDSLMLNNYTVVEALLGTASCNHAPDPALMAAKQETEQLSTALGEAKLQITSVQGQLNVAKSETVACRSRLAAAEAARSRPIADALAALLEPNNKRVKKLKPDPTDPLGDAYEVNSSIPGIVDVGMRRQPADAESWYFGISAQAGKLRPDDFGVVEKICGNRPVYYRITSGPLKGAFIEDQLQDQFLVANAAYLRNFAWAWKCGGKVLQ